MKRTLAILLSALMLLGILPGVALATAATATADGFGGEVRVALSVEDGKLADVTIIGDSETPGIGGTAVEVMAEAMLARNTIEVDAMSGATITSEAILKAAADALGQLGVTLTPVVVDDAVAPAEDVTVDVVVVGAGLAGLTAAYDLRAAGMRVILVEKRAITGGNSATAGKFDVGGSKAQVRLGVNYTADDHYESVYAEVAEAIEVTHAAKCDFEPFVRFFTSNNGAYMDWLEEMGLEVASVQNGKEIYGPTGTRASTQACTLLTEAVENEGVDLRLSTAAKALIADEAGKVTGITVEGPASEYNIYADAVILATGGFAADYDLVAEFVPGWEGKPTSNTPATTGDGIKMARAVGAKLTNMDSVTLNPSFHTDANGTTFSRSGVRYNGGILIDKTNAQRFCDEMGDYTAASLAELALPEQSAWAIMDANNVSNAADCVSAETLEELAEVIGVPADKLVATVERYNGWVDQGKDEDFGKTDFRARLETGPWYAMDVFPGLHNTHGGVAINLRNQVLDTGDQLIEGLYAAGCVSDVMLFGAEALTAAGVFGRNAAASVLADIG